MKRSVKYVLNAVLILVLTALTTWYLSKTQIVTMKTLRSLRFVDCFVVTLWVYTCFAFLSFIEKIVYSTFCKYPYKTALLTTVYGALGSAVSPLKTAHFPLKAYAQKSNGIPFLKTLTGITKCQIIFSTTSVLVYATLVVFFIVNKTTVFVMDVNVPVYLVVSIGFIANLLILVVLTLISRIEKLRTAILTLVACFIKLFSKKFDKAEFVQKKTERLRLFKEQTSAVFSNFKLFIFPAVLYAIYMFLTCLAPYVSYLCVTNTFFSLNDCLQFYVLTLASTYLTNVIPTPGGCAVAEFVFAVVFKLTLKDFLAPTLLLWRVSTYYIPTIINLIIFAFRILLRGRSNV